jgi:A/G-specific adenine glycosylase
MDRQRKVSGGELLNPLRKALEEKRPKIQEGILSWAASNLPRYPWRQSGKTPYEVLLGEFWLKETSSVVATRVYPVFLQRYFSIQSLAEAREDDITDILSRFGLRQYAQHIRALVDSLLKEGKGDLPRDSEIFARASRLEQYHVNIILCFGYGLPVAIIDVNVARMLSRLFGHSLPSPPAPGLLQAIGESLVSYRSPQQYNCGLLDLAEMVCREEDALCTRCTVKGACDYIGGV